MLDFPKVMPKELLSKMIIGAIIGLIVGAIIYYGISFSLLGSKNYYNDCSYRYIISAIQLWGGKQLPIIEHPGIPIMTLGGAYFAFLKFFNFPIITSLEDLSASNHPFYLLINLLIVSRWLNILIFFVFLFFVYRIAYLLSHRKNIASTITFFFAIQVGIVEHVFIVRPELLSALFVLIGIERILAIQKTTNEAAIVLTACGLGLVSVLAILSKVLVIIYLPLLGIGCFILMQRLKGASHTSIRYIQWGIASINSLFFIFWINGIHQGFILSLFKSKYSPLLLKAFPLLVGFKYLFIAFILCVFLLNLRLLNLESYWKSCVDKFNRFLLVINCFCLGVFLGASTVFINGASSKILWGKKILIACVGETVGALLLGHHQDSSPFDGFYYVFNHQLRFLFSHMTFLWGSIILTLILSRWARHQKKVWILLLYLVLTTLLGPLRGASSFTFYYQIYTLIIASLILSICLPKLFDMVPQKYKSMVLLILAAFITVDGIRASHYRETLFPQRRPAKAELEIMNYASRDVIYHVLLNGKLKKELDINCKSEEERIQYLANMFQDTEEKYYVLPKSADKSLF
jgi:hypothetical protein